MSYQLSNLLRFCVWLILLHWVQSAPKFVKGLAQEAVDVWDFVPAYKNILERTEWSPRHAIG